ncbi:MAG: TlpA family protein disulfide reductase [Saprospirales bacterium]|jgi:thiol-disulfide isomerase/thioredoxin|nr:TlpA family protein disulfide reductase [Saprospirales bacterium]MBK8923041.1 TlpA family protein disulfide reductase [Saprospirales bacterium]
MSFFTKTVFFAFAAAAIFSGCLTTDTAYTRIAPGRWRGVLELEKFNMPVRDKDTIFTLKEQFREGELPFNFEVKYLDQQRFYIEIFNGAERIRCDSIQYGRDRSTARDTFNIFFPEYGSYIHAAVRGGVMQGEWVVTTKTNYRIPFYAHAGRDYRFTSLNAAPVADLSGDWATLFGIDQAEPERAIGEFRQQGNHLEGTFRTETGDYRFLEGTVQGRKFWLSCFDGAHAYLFSGSIHGDTLRGEFRSGTHYRTLWNAWRDPDFHLLNPDSISALKPGASGISFSLATPEGKTIRFPSDAFRGKIKIFTLMGTWCPNCRDEQQFLVEFLKQNPGLADKMEIVGFAFERYKDVAKANAHIQTYKNRMGIPFELVYAGPADKKAAGNVFPALNEVVAFPTMIILDKANNVRRVHTGFDGPATSRYAAFAREFSGLMRQLAAE